MPQDLPARIAANLDTVRRRIDAAAAGAGRDPAEIRLLLAVKTQPVETIRAALDAGADLLGHNRAQELAATGPPLAEAGVPPHEMHFIGHLQSNKVNQVLRWATCVQSVNSVRLATRLDQAVARAGRAPLDVLVEVNTAAEATKTGADPADAVELATAVGALEHLRLRGFMTIGAHSPDPAEVRRSYDRLARLRAEILASAAPGTQGAHALSMGMSGDLEIAVAAGATMVRVGTAVFGARPYP
ncbi:YggS family pyridoxal phosphate-dependent enzyme [Georgenia yuyongxinii]|uniref:Pyridoxal phosphate homeostasis protein n=1 Tax=Georgenia yuyongxinii TaxID=2589797 RepID=A0A552WPE7_9MICO|nr:YggS family pyridoxal phosphate-dependent enzyme [Georgenia yuyongxinii]TRW44646.1 YggS family pyridoxal phosphate-dependent enzyme [Georgenia yuyongxinii]